MHNFFINQEQIDYNNKKIKILGKDVNHIKNVLRGRIGDFIYVNVNKANVKYICQIESIDKDKIICSIVKEQQENNETGIYINIVQGLPKLDKMELVIQKCTELGVKEFTPLALKRCVVKIDKKDEAKKLARWQAIAEVASKQCGRNQIPVISEIQDIKTIGAFLKDYDYVFIAYEQEKETTLKMAINNMDNSNKQLKVAIIIGPEGGIDETEIEQLQQYGFNSISLGKRILRTETVAFVITSIIMYEVGELGG